MKNEIDIAEQKTLTELKNFLSDESNKRFIKVNFFGYWYGDSIFGLSVKEVHKYGGCGEGYTYGNVLEFKDINNKTLNVEFYGHWISHVGSEFEGWRIVEPKQKTITVWE